MSKDYIRGPWHVGPVDDTCITDSDGNEVAWVEGDYDSSSYEMEARARLIAAAPELLEACERAELWIGTIPGGEVMRDVMRSALTKASPVVQAEVVSQSEDPHYFMVDYVSGQRIRERERYD